jgi:hypothetical protein
MAIRIAIGAGVVVALAAFATMAEASPCYVVLDKSNNVIYQSTHPPVDLSVQGAAARDAMRHRGEFMESFESQRCVERNARSASGKGEASVEEIVAGLKPYQRVGRVGAMNDADADSGRFVDPSGGSAPAPRSY